MANYKSSIAKTCHHQWLHREKYNLVESGLISQFGVNVQEGNVQTALKAETHRDDGVDSLLTPAGRALPTVVIQSCWESDYEKTLKEPLSILGKAKAVDCKLEVYTYHGRYNYKARPAKPTEEHDVLATWDPELGWGDETIALSAYDIHGDDATPKQVHEQSTFLSLAVLRSLVYSTVQLDATACGPLPEISGQMNDSSSESDPVKELANTETTLSKLMGPGPLIFSPARSNSGEGECTSCESPKCCCAKEHGHATQRDWKRVGTLGPYPWMNFAAYTTLYMPIITVPKPISNDGFEVIEEEPIQREPEVNIQPPKTPDQKPTQVITPPPSPAQTKKLPPGPTTMNTKEFKEECDNGRKLVVVDDVIADIEPFIKEHPGGEKILAGVGHDVSESFKDGHNMDTPEAKDKLKDLEVAQLVDPGEWPDVLLAKSKPIVEEKLAPKLEECSEECVVNPDEKKSIVNPEAPKAVQLIQQIEGLLLQLQACAVPNPDSPQGIEQVGLGMTCTPEGDQILVDIHCSMMVRKEVHDTSCPNTRKLFGNEKCSIGLHSNQEVPAVVVT